MTSFGIGPITVTLWACDDGWNVDCSIEEQCILYERLPLEWTQLEVKVWALNQMGDLFDRWIRDGREQVHGI